MVTYTPLFGQDPYLPYKEVTFEITKEFHPSYLPQNPISENLRIAILPPENSEKAFYEFALKYSTIRNYIDFTTPFCKTLHDVTRRLFPRTVSVNSLEKGNAYDVILRPSVRARVTRESSEVFQGYEVTTKVQIETGTGQIIDVIETSGSANFRRFHWSEQTRADTIGVTALVIATDKLIHKMYLSRTFLDHLNLVLEKVERPANISTSALFDDRDAVFPDSRLNAGETASVEIRIINHGPGTAFGTKVSIKTAESMIILPTELTIGDLPPQEEKVIQANISADLSVTSQIVQLHIHATERRGFDGSPLILEVATQALAATQIRIADVAISDSGGRAQGDGDGLPANGETVEAIIRIGNDGPGTAAGIILKTFSSTNSFQILDPEVALPGIAAGRIREARVRIHLPANLQDDTLTVAFEASEIRGQRVSVARTTETWKVKTKRPQLELGYHLYDGNSAASQGNRDGNANNGELLELAIDVSNAGELTAQGVVLEIQHTDPNVKIEPSKFTIARIPPQSKSQELRTQIYLPRQIWIHQPVERLAFSVRLTQDDFPPSSQPLSLPFRLHQPELAIKAVLPQTLREGEISPVALYIENRGPAAAEAVNLGIRSEGHGLVLLDERQVSQEHIQVSLGTIPAYTSSSKVGLLLLQKHGSDLRGAIRASVTQSDFPSTQEQFYLPMSRGMTTIIPAPVTPQASEDPLNERIRSVATPAAISFLLYKSGDRLTQEAVVLRFEIQAMTALQTLRLLQNGRSVPLDPPLDESLPDRDTRIWRYEVPVRLLTGENHFEVVALTAEGRRSERSLDLYRHHEQGKLWVAAIGISKYVDPDIPDLDFAERDATEFYNYYHNLVGIPKEQMFLLVDEQATLQNIKSTLGTKLVNKAINPDDTVIIYFAGHGQKEPDVASSDPDGFSKYLLPYDGSRADLFGTAIAMEEIAGILRRLRPQRIVFILDSCFSGGAGGRNVFDPHLSTRSPLTDEFLARVANAGRGRVVLTASGANELARESPHLGHGVFTHYLLQGLRGQADDNHDSLVDVEEAYRFTWQKVVQETKGQQNPTKKAPDLVGTIIMGKRGGR